MSLLEQKIRRPPISPPCQKIDPTESANQSANQSATQPKGIGLRLSTAVRSADRVDPGIVSFSNPFRTRFISSFQSVNSGWSDFDDTKRSSKKNHIVNKFRKSPPPPLSENLSSGVNRSASHSAHGIRLPADQRGGSGRGFRPQCSGSVGRGCQA